MASASAMPTSRPQCIEVAVVEREGPIFTAPSTAIPKIKDWAPMTSDQSARSSSPTTRQVCRCKPGRRLLGSTAPLKVCVEREQSHRHLPSPR